METSEQSKLKQVTDIYPGILIDLVSVYASIYVTEHPECATALFKYMHIIRIGVSKSTHMGWCEYISQPQD